MATDFLLADADFDAFDRFMDELDAKIERCQGITDRISALCASEPVELAAAA